jgi:hypothetical protein
MKRIFYAGGSIVTGDRTAQAVAQYAEALAMRENSAMVDIPVLVGTGETGRAQLLIGPASQLAVVPEPGDDAGPDDDAIIDDLEKQTAALSSPHPRSGDFDINPLDEYDGRQLD